MSSEDNLLYLNIAVYNANHIVVESTFKQTSRCVKWQFLDGIGHMQIYERRRRSGEKVRMKKEASTTTQLYTDFMCDLAKKYNSHLKHVIVTGLPPFVNLSVPFKTPMLDIFNMEPIASLNPYFGLLDVVALKKIKITNRITNLGQCITHPWLNWYDLHLDVNALNVLLLSQVISNNFTVVLGEEVNNLFTTEDFDALVRSYSERPIGFSMKLKMNVFNHPLLINHLCVMPGWQLKNLNREICAAFNTDASDIYVTCNTVAGYFHVRIMEQFTAVDPSPDPIQEALFPTVVIPFAKSLSIEDRIKGESKATWFKDVPYNFKRVFINFNKGQVTIDGLEVSKGGCDLCRVFLKYFVNKFTTIQVMEILGAWDLFVCKAQIKELILHYPGPLPPLFFASLLHNKLEKLAVDTLEVMRNAPELMKNAKEVVVLGSLPSSSNSNSIIMKSTSPHLEYI